MRPSGRGLLLMICLTVGVLVFGVGTVATLVWYAVPGVTVDQAFQQKYSLELGDFYFWQPGKTKAFLAGCLSAPLFLGAGCLLARAARPRLQLGPTKLLFKGLVGLVGLVVVACLVPMFFCPAPPLPDMPPHWFFYFWYFHARPAGWESFVVSSLIVGTLCWWLSRQSARPQILNRVFFLLAAIWTMLVPLRFYAPSDIVDDVRFIYHFNAVADALSQVANGRHYLVDFPHIYGGYVEFMGPLLAVLPRTVESFLFPLPVLSNLAVLALLGVARLTIRQPFLLWITGLGLFGLEYLLGDDDHYYQYFAIRMFFPCLGLLAAALYLRRANRLGYAGITIWAAVATIWNFETGIVFWASWLSTLLVMRFVPLHLPSLVRRVAFQAGALVTAWFSFFVYLRLASGEWPRLELLFSYQQLVTETGYFCIRIIVPDLWVLFLLICAMGLGACAVFCFQKMASWRTYFCFLLVLVSVGDFSYFIGRSSESNLVLVSYTLLLLIGLLLSETWRLVSRHRLPRAAWLLLSPAILILSWWTYLATLALPGLLAESIRDIRAWQHPEPSLVDLNAAFIRHQTSPGDRAYFLSDHSGFYYYLSDAINPLRIPGPVELLWTRDIDTLVSAIDAGTIPQLYVDDNFFSRRIYKHEVPFRLRQAIARHYRLAATGPTGTLSLYLPR